MAPYSMDGILGVPENLVFKNNRKHCLEQRTQPLDQVDQTYLVVATGKQVPQK